MAYNLAIKLLPEEIRTLLAPSITNAYMGVGNSFEHPIRIIFVQNLTDQLMDFSFDGITRHFVLAANSFLLLDVTTNKTITQGCFIAEGQRLYVKYSVMAPTNNPGSGIYITTFYGADN